MPGWRYNICATPQTSEIIHLLWRNPRLADHRGVTGRRKLAPRTSRPQPIYRGEDPSGTSEGHEEGAELHGLEALRNLAVLPGAGNLDHPETRLSTPALPKIGFAEHAAVIGIAMHGRIVRYGSPDAELVHGHHETEAPTRPQHRHDRAHRGIHVAHVLEHGEGISEIEPAGLEVFVHFLGEALAEGGRRPPVELLGDLDVGEGHLDAVDGQLRVPGAERHGHPPLATARVEHAARLDGLHLALELLELRVTATPLDHLARLLPREHTEPLLEQLEPHFPAQALVLLLLRGDIRLAAFQMPEPRADARALLGVAGLGARGMRRLQDLERAVDVFAVELESHRLDHAVHIAGIEQRRRQ